MLSNNFSLANIDPKSAYLSLIISKVLRLNSGENRRLLGCLRRNETKPEAPSLLYLFANRWTYLLVTLSNLDALICVNRFSQTSRITSTRFNSF